MAVGNLGRPRSRPASDSDVIAIPVPTWHKQALEQEARAAGCRSLAEFVRQRNGWPDVSRQMGPKPKEPAMAS